MKSKHVIYTILGVLISLSLVFIIKDRITGYQLMSTRVVVTMPEPNLCNISFESGWNLVSFPCITEDIGVMVLLYNDSFVYDTIRSYNAFDANDPWKSYSKNLPNWTVQDTMLSRKSGYWIYVPDQYRLIINNSLGTPSIISLTDGWNLVGYPSKTINESSQFFSQIEPNFEYVYMYNSSDPVDKWKLYKWNASLPGTIILNYTLPNYGYWIYMTSADGLYLP